MRLKLRHRIGLLVVLAGVALLVVTAMLLVLGKRSQDELTGIETRYVPLIELDRDLKRTYAELSRALEDAAGAGEESRLEDGDRLAGEFHALLVAGGRSIVDNGGDPKALATAFDRYYKIAREVSAALVIETPSAQITGAIEAMRAAQSELDALLDAHTSPNRTKLAAAFTSARGAQETLLRIEIIVACLAVLLMAVLSWRTIRSMIRSLAAVSSGVERLARGEFAQEIDVPPGDEIADLAREANRTAARLRTYREQSEREVWIKNGVAELGDAIAGELAVPVLAGRAMVQLADYVGATSAAISVGETVVGHRLERVPATLPHDGAVRVLADDARVLRVTPSEIVTPLIHLDTTFGVLVLAVPADPDARVLDLLGRASSTVGIALRVAESRARNAALLVETERQARAAEMANKELEAFSYSVSHDLRAPLRTIDGFSAALVEDDAPNLSVEGKEHVRRIRAGAKRMSDLIDDLLRLSRVSRGELHKEPVDLQLTAMAVVAELRRAQPEREVAVTIADELTAVADARLVRIILENLIGNAWKFTAKVPAATIEVGARTEAGERVYFVRDNGAGFDMQYVDQLFGAFQRLHHEKDFAGTGIGLATVQRIIVRHGGRIWATGDVDAGATFQFTLPA